MAMTNTLKAARAFEPTLDAPDLLGEEAPGDATAAAVLAAPVLDGILAGMLVMFGEEMEAVGAEKEVLVSDRELRAPLPLRVKAWE